MRVAAQSIPWKPVITVFRKVSQLGNRCWFYADGRPIPIKERKALNEAERGLINIKTVN